MLNILDMIGKELEKNVKTNNTIIVKGAHLCMTWLQNLPAKLVELSLAYNNKYNIDFSKNIRIILLLEPKSGFPAGLSRISWRICLQ